MNHFTSLCTATALAAGLIFSAGAQTAGSTDAAQKAPAATTQTAKAPAPAKKADTLEIVARVLEIPGTFPPNDLYNYVYIMKYRVVKVLKGTYVEKDILVGQYNPLIARKNIKDKMDKFVDGDVTKFEVNGKHRLLLIKPIEAVWQEALEDEYFDAKSDKYYALKTDVAQ